MPTRLISQFKVIKRTVNMLTQAEHVIVQFLSALLVLHALTPSVLIGGDK